MKEKIIKVTPSSREMYALNELNRQGKVLHMNLVNSPVRLVPNGPATVEVSIPYEIAKEHYFGNREILAYSVNNEEFSELFKKEIKEKDTVISYTDTNDDNHVVKARDVSSNTPIFITEEAIKSGSSKITSIEYPDHTIVRYDGGKVDYTKMKDYIGRLVVLSRQGQPMKVYTLSKVTMYSDGDTRPDFITLDGLTSDRIIPVKN